MRTPEEKRKARLRDLANKVQEDGESDLRALEGWGGLKWGSKRETVRSYVDVLESAGLVVVVGDVVKWVSTAASTE